jgi:hypothetical protein
MKHPYDVKKLVREDRKKVLSKRQQIKANTTETGKPADPVELDPAKQGMQNTSLTN